MIIQIRLPSKNKMKYLKSFNRTKKMKRDFEKFNLNRCLNYTIHVVIKIIVCKPDPITGIHVEIRK